MRCTTDSLTPELAAIVATAWRASRPVAESTRPGALIAAHTAINFPELHWRKIWSTNPIERLNREVKRRTDVVGIFPNAAALHRLSACVLIEAHDEWQVSDRRYLSGASMALLTPPAPTALQPRPAEEVLDTLTA